ncbi:MAG: hypothetical protein R3B95_07750 [Nitrospirales bacterium]|nr:hypothetical protein [Nitrospirales bacterium]
MTNSHENLEGYATLIFFETPRKNGFGKGRGLAALGVLQSPTRRNLLSIRRRPELPTTGGATQSPAGHESEGNGCPKTTDTTHTRMLG